MPYYIILGNWTDEGIRSVRDLPKRLAAARAAVEKAGGIWHGMYFTFGQYDMVIIAEAPNDELVMSVALAIGSQGAARTTTLKAFSESEAAKIIEKLPAK